MAKSKSAEVDVDEILDELDDELEDADELDAEDDPTEERPKKKGRNKRAAAKKSKSKGKANGAQFGTAWLADQAGTDPRSLRMLLRAEFPKGDGGRYEWSGPNDPEAKAIIKRVRAGGATDAKNEKLADLKASKGKKKSSAKKKTTAKKSTSSKAERARKRRAERAAAKGDDDE